MYLPFLSIHQRILKNVSVSTKILCRTTLFNIDSSKKRILSSKSAY